VRENHGFDEQRLVVCAVGATQDWFQAGAGRGDRGSEEPLKVCYFGLFTPFHGTVFSAQAARSLRDEPIEFTFVGTGQARAAAEKAAADARIRWIDWVPAADLPRLVAAHDVCLGVFGAEEKTARVVPMKVYQGAAAGCAVVTANSPPIARTFGDTVVMIPPARADLLADALRVLQADRGVARRYGERATRVADAFRSAAVARVVSTAVANLRAE
jgi:glycosyltransferase involved in cell wall biosynthesis